MNAVLYSLGWSLYHSLWQCAASALLVLAVLAITRQPRARYTAACIALAASLAAFIVTFSRYMAASGSSPWKGIPIPPLVRPDDFSSTIRSATGFGTSELLPWLVLLWIAGVAVFQLRAVRSWVAARRLLHRGVCSAPEQWQRRLGELAARFRLQQSVTLLETCLAEVPAVIGSLRPVILVPAGLLTSMAPSQIEAILLHELAHILRRDYLANLLQTVTEGLLYFHPAIWWISGVIRTEREHCCDDLAVAAMRGDAGEYASALAALEQTRWGFENRENAAMAATGGSLLRRVHRLLYPRQPIRVPFVWAALPLLLAAVGVLAAWQTTPPKDDPYIAWLKEDVAYIIQDAERVAFLQLQSYEEREHFIEQFWLRRDPTPGTPENEYKEEHYRRIAYANDHFGYNDTPGWQADRGRIYIIYGPPDELESHPLGQGGRKPWEDWLYRWIDGVGNNVIITFDGEEYRMASDPHKR
jgi:GWxTD domain-containing protein